MASNQTYLGTLKDQFAVDPDGGASYAISLKLPPGTAGMMPKLSLAYNSGANNGLLGVGWNLSGLSMITRSPQTVAQDGAFGTISYSDGDRFSLDGERLMVVNGVDYHDPTAIYHTERESWQKVVPVYNSNRPSGRNGPDGFIVYQKDGKVLEYGSTPDSQVPASSTNPSIRNWCVNKVSDRNGNYLTITYQSDATNNVNYPLQIDYTGNAKTGLVPQRSVRFVYETRQDAFPQYLGGYPITTTQRMKQIQTYLDNQLIRSYNLHYEQGLVSGRSRLKSVTETDAAEAALTPTVFNWQDGRAEIFSEFQSMPTQATWQGNFVPMDFNGDGLIDLVNVFENDGSLQLSLFHSNGQQFAVGAENISTQIPYGAQLIPMDINGDGCIDLVCASQNNGYLELDILVSTLIDEQWTLVPLANNPVGPANLPYGGTLLAMDVDGDGLTDLVYAYENNNNLCLSILFSNGSGFEQVVPDLTTTATYFPQAPLLALDFNGDRLTDLVYAYEDSGNIDLVLFLSQGRSGFVQQTTSPLPENSNITAAGVLLGNDLNADGLGDIVQVYLNNGQLMVQPIVSNGIGFEVLPAQTFDVPNLGSDVPNLLPTDTNGNGLLDLVVATQNNSSIQVSVLRGTGTGFNSVEGVTQPSATASWGSPVLPLDYVGAGQAALVFASASETGTIALGAMPVKGEFPDLMTGITNGLGGTLNITYNPLTNPAVYSKKPNPNYQKISVNTLLSSAVSGATFQIAPTPTATGSPGTTYSTRIVDFPKYVVSNYQRSDGRSSTYAYRYQYETALLDLTGRGWLGFQQVTAIDVEMETQTQTQYSQLFPETHSPQTVTITRSTDAALMRKDTYTYQSQINAPNTGANIHLVQPTQLQVDYYTFADPTNPVSDCTEIKTMGYDEFGNESLLAQTGSAVGTPLYTHHTYQNDPANWRFGFVIEEKKSADSEGNQVLTWAKTVYNPTTLDQTQHQLWNDQTQQWQTTTYTYDDYGNNLTAQDYSGAVVSFTYDNTYHTFKHTETGINAAGKTLTTTTTYYPEFGVVNTKTDPNNVAQTQQLDGLGRVTQIQGPDPNGNTVTLSEVSWATDSIGPYRKTVTPGGWKQEYMDGLKRVYRTTALGADGSSTAIVDKTFNGQGKTLTQSLPYYEGNTPLFVTNTYDNYGRLVQVVKPYQNTTLTTAMVFEKINQMTQTEAKGQTDTRVTQTVYNTFNGDRHPISQTHVLSDGQTATTTYAYDALGRLLNVTDPIGVAHVATYDSLNRKISGWQEVNGTKQFVHTYQHDDANRKLIHTDPKGTVSTQIYDPLGRLIERDMQPAANSGMQPKKTTYVLDDPTHAYSQGKVSSVTLSDGEVYLFEYDPCGNQAKTTIQLDGESYLFEKVYNVMGQVQTLTFPDGSVQTNSYNASAQRDGVSLQNGSKAQQAAAKYTAFNAFGMSTQATIGVETLMEMAYGIDDTGLLNSQSLTDVNGNAIANTSFAWNDFHQLNSIQDEVNSDNSQSYQYDPVGRLQNASGDYGDQDYHYDLGGNLTLKDGITYQSDGHQVKTGTQNGETVFNAIYDDNGNMTSATRNGVTTTYTYDADNHLVQSGDVTLTYDYTGRRLKKQIQGDVTTYYLAPYYQVNVFPNGAKQHTIFVMGNHGVLAAVTGVDAGTPTPTKGVPAPGVFYLYQDHLQNSVYQIDPQGNKTTSIRYRPFGEIHYLEGDDTVQQKFTGKEWDDSLQLYYFGARYYDPALGRFITQDDQLGAPMGHHDALHRYCYTTNDPTNLIDPDGHSTGWEWFFHALADAALIVAGIVVMAATVFGGPAATILGSTLLGAGVGGAAYDITQAANHKNLSWKNWGVQVGIGAAAGFVSGGFAAGAGALVDAGAAAAETAGNAVSAARWAVRGAYRIAANVGLGGIVGNAASGAVGAAFNNYVNSVYPNHGSMGAGVGFAAVLGAGFGFLGGLGSELAALGLSSSAEQLTPAARNATRNIDLLDQVDRELNIDNLHPDLRKFHENLLTDQLDQKTTGTYLTRVMKSTVRNNVFVSVPGSVTTFVDGLMELVPNQPTW